MPQPTDHSPAMRVILDQMEAERRAANETRHAENLGRLTAAGGFDPNQLGPAGRETLVWLCGWSERSIAGFEEILAATREAAR